VGTFGGDRARAASRARAEWADPLPVILDFHHQLQAAGIELLFVPVPPKAAIYADRLPRPRPETSGRADAAAAAFYQLLRERGVDVLDLAPELERLRVSEKRPLYCRQDSHWAGPAIELTARRIAEWARARPFAAAWPREAFADEPVELEITGDLWKLLGDDSLPRERVRLRMVGRRAFGALAPIEPSRQSPVLLLGDSHNLVWHDGDMHARGAGLPDHLARELGFPVDLVAVPGSGATPARVNLLRRGDSLAGKKLVVWVLSAREFTEAPRGWRPVPISAAAPTGSPGAPTVE
jgi:alginate O-acetyltransferase complex protein AlgJ